MLNYDNGTNPRQLISDGYKEKDTSKPFEVRDEIGALREMYQKDPNSLNSVQLLTLGMANLSAKNNQDSEVRRIDDDKDAQKDDKGGEKGSEKDKADTTESLQAKIDALQAKLAEVIGGGNE
ncbi:hypothetical protein ABES23_06145 [Peribacillus frigoritolerans]|uniref:hypothetical protein n=1 Tax=Peribacillus frigoritolerans TaxID=450367 RepID=UPI003D28D5E3